jgi:hypothetical protein
VNPYSILKSYEHNGVLGELTDRSDSELDLFFREAHRESQRILQDARQQAIDEKREVRIDCSRLSGVNGGEWWVIDVVGRVRKQLQRFSGVERQLQANAASNSNYKSCAAVDRARPLFARIAYNGLWSPSGTNWQPIRSIELQPQEVAAITEKPSASCGLLVLARRQYDSILGDIAALCGLEQTSHAEYIDLGIWLFAAQQTARSHGWEIECHPITTQSVRAATERIIRILNNRISPLAEPLKAAAIALRQSLEASDHYPYCILVPLEDRPLSLDEKVPGKLTESEFDRLIEARSTQRVASPEGELTLEHMVALYQSAERFIPDEALRTVSFPVFSWSDPFSESVGKAMHEAVEGPGGLMDKANYINLISHLNTHPPLPVELNRWAESDESALEKAGQNVALPARFIPNHIRSKLLKGNVYTQQEGILYDRRKRPLTPVRFLKFTRMILASFVRFSLSFQNTHPVLGVVMTPTAPQDAPALYIAAGKAVAYMTFLSRAYGQVSIIKSGPPEIAADAIRGLVAQHASDPDIGNRAERREAEPVLTFQIGLPLGPDDLVSQGKPEEHNGLNERLLDRRASRAALYKHYIPVAT